MKNCSFLIIISIISTFILSIQCGHIFSQPTQINPQNAGIASQFTLTFMLETSLASDDYLYIKFPMTVGLTSATLSSYMSSTTTALTTTNLVGSTDYNFYSVGSALSSGSWYTITVTVTTMSGQSAGIAGCVYFATTSAAVSSYITYDENRCFDVISFAPAIDTTVFTVNGYVGNAYISSYTSVGTTYTAIFDIYPNVQVNDAGGNFYFQILQGDATDKQFANYFFSFGSTCSVIGCTSNDGTTAGTDYCPSTGINAIKTGTTCTGSGNTLNLTVAQAFNTSAIRIAATINTPYFQLSERKIMVTFTSSAQPSLIYAQITSITAGSVNPLIVKTVLASSYTLTPVVSLMWGLQPSSSYAYQSSGYIGCPIVLYISYDDGSSSARITQLFNSLKTSFTTSATIPAYPAHNLLSVQFSIFGTTTTYIQSLITSSISTNLPGTVSIDSKTNIVKNYITISQVTSLYTSTTYYIGVKFSLNNDAVGLISLISGQSSPYCGLISISTGDTNSLSLASTSGTQIGVKRSFTYADKTATAYGSGSKAGYNQIFSYWPTGEISGGSSNEAADSTVFGSYMLGLSGGGAPSTSGVWMKPTGVTANQGLFISLYFTSTAVCTTGTSYLSVSTPTTCSGTIASGNPDFIVLLKIMFNNGILGIMSTEQLKAAALVGNLFSTGANIKAYGTNLTPTSGSLYNTIFSQATTGYSTFYHLSILCQDATTYGCYSTTAFLNGGNVAGVAFPNVVISAYPSPYVDTTVFDFLICLKIATYSLSTTITAEDSTSAKFVLVEEGCTTSTCHPVAGPALINGYVISGAVDPTLIKTSVVNGYYTTTGSVDSGLINSLYSDFIPAYLRIGVTFTAISGNILGFFLNGGDITTSTNTFYMGLSAYQSSTYTVPVIDTLGSQTTATLMQGVNVGYDGSNVDLWFAHHAVLMSPSTATTATTYNYYIPIQVGFKSILSFNVVMGTKTSLAWKVTGVYRVYGSIFGNEILATTYTLTSGISYAGGKFTVATNAFDCSVVSSALKITATSGTNNGLCAVDFTTGAGCFNKAPTTTTLPQMTDSSAYYPGLVRSLTTGVTINSEVLLPTGGSCQISTGNTGTGNNWGSAFIVYTRDSNLFGSASKFTWGYAGSGTGTQASPINKCVPQTVIYGSSSIYTVFCTVDVVSGGVSTGSFGGSTTLVIAPVTIPFYWGKSYDLLSNVNYAWSSITGYIASFNGDTSDTTTTAWTYTSCKVTAVTLNYDSYDFSFQLNVNTLAVTYTLAASKSLILTLTGYSSYTIGSVCTSSISGTSCGYASGAYTLKNTGTSTITISSAIVITGWITTTSVTSVEVASSVSNTVTVVISYNGLGNAIETCTQSNGVLASNSPLSTSMTVSITSWTSMLNAKARGVFSFSFTYPSSRPIKPNYYVTLSLGTWASTTANSGNYRCLINSDPYGTVSNLWYTISSIDTSTYKTTLITKSSISGGTFYFKCIGGQTWDATTGTLSDSSNAVSAILTDGSTSTTISNISLTYVAPTPSATFTMLSLKSFTKLYKAQSFDSDYIFSFIPTANNVTTAGRIVVEFSKSIPPRLNRDGVLECYIDGVLANCEITSPEERRVVVWPTKSLLTTASYAYNLTIAGVTQPNAGDVDSNALIFFALFLSDSTYGAISEAAWVTESFDTTTITTQTPAILINSFTVGSNKFRSTTSFTIGFNVSAGTFSSLTSNATMIIKFPASLRSFLLYGGSPSVTLYRVGGTTGKASTSSNLANSVTVLTGGRVAVNITADINNTLYSMNYSLTISGVSTPSFGSTRMEDFLIYVNNTSNGILTSSAASCRNSQNFISWDSSSYSTSFTLAWADALGSVIVQNPPTPITVMIGTYSKWSLTTVNSSTFTKAITFSPLSSTYFTAQPGDSSNSSIRTFVSTSYALFYIGAKVSTPQGLYSLAWSKSDSSSSYSPIPPLPIKASAQTCQPIISATTFYVPYAGGISDPIVVDFSNCIPVNDVTVNATLTTGWNNTASDSQISISQAKSTTKSLTFGTIFDNYKVYFYVQSNSYSNGTSSVSAGTVDFYFTGTNAGSYLSPGTVYITLIPSSSTVPTATINSFDASTDKLNVECDQNGMLYFALGTGSSASSYSLLQITNYTETALLSLATLGSTDPYHIVFGYVAGLIGGTAVNIDLSGYLKAGAYYQAYAYCRTNSLISSTSSSTNNFTVDDNNGKTVILSFNFQAKLTKSQKFNFACVLVRKFQISSKFILTDDNQYCTSERLLQSSNSTNSTNTTNTTTTTTTTTNSSTVNASYPSLFSIQKNYFVTSDTNYATVIAATSQSSFLTNVMAAVMAIDSSFPASSDNTFTILPLYISSTNSSLVPVVNVVGTPVTDYKSVNITFNLTNVNGIVYAGIIPSPASGLSNSYPNSTELFQGYDGNSSKLTDIEFMIVPLGGSGTINFTTNLNSSTNYTIYYMASDLDMSIDALTSSVAATSAQTTTPGSSFNSVMKLSMLALGVLFLEILGLI